MNTSNQRSHAVHRARNAIAKEYSGLAGQYDSRWSFYVEQTTRETIKRLQPGPTDRILDIGCGTGALLGSLSDSYPAAQLFGIDPVAEMLAMARHRLPGTVELCQAWAEELPFAADQFDTVLSCNVFHYIAQPAAALREIMRVLRPGGQLVITDWCDDYWACRLCSLYLHLFNRAQVTIYDQRECAQLLQDAGFNTVDIDRYKIDWLWGLMTARATSDTITPSLAWS